MSTLPVFTVDIRHDPQTATERPLSERCRVIRLSDLDALREGLEKMERTLTARIVIGQYREVLLHDVLGLLAMLPPREPSVPYPEWCRHKDQCAGRVSCPDDPTCAD